MSAVPARADHAPSTVGSWWIVALLMVTVAVSHFNRIGMSVAGTEAIMPQYGVPPTTMGWVYTSYLVVYTLCMVPGGWFIDRRGPRAALMLVGFGSAALVALTGLAGFVLQAGGPLIGGLLLIRGLLGAVTAPLHPGAARSIVAWVPIESRATANGLIHGAALAGITATYSLFGGMIGGLGWMNAFLAAAVAPLLLALVWTGRVANPPDDDPGASQAAAPAPLQAWSARTKLSLALLTFSYATVSYVQYLFFYWIEHYYKTVLELGTETARRNSTLLTLAMGAGIMAGGWLCDQLIRRLGRRAGTALIPLAGTVTCGLGLAGGIASADQTAAFACFMVAMAAIGTAEGAFWTGATDVGGRQPGRACAVMNTGGNAGGLLAPVITPLFSDIFGWQAGLGLAAAICLLGAVPWLWIDGTADAARGQPT